MNTSHTISARPNAAFVAWFDALYARHTAALQFAEIRRALTALSTIYVQRRDKLAQGAALGSAGKRAAFALFYTPLHTLLVQAIVAALPTQTPATLLDLGCGTGAAAMGWALAAGSHSGMRVRGIDVSAFALAEARWNWQTLGVQGSVRSADLRHTRLTADDSLVLAYVLNELPDDVREAWKARLLGHKRDTKAAQMLIMEPISGRVAPWYAAWEALVLACGGRSDIWQVHMQMPERLALLDKAAGLNHRTFKVRTLFLPQKR